MSKTNFQSLQRWHENLLKEQAELSGGTNEDFTEKVKEFIEQTKNAGIDIYSGPQREQLRAFLRYWANYLYNIDRVFPNIELAPATAGGKFLVIRYGVLFGVLVVLIIIALVAGSYISPSLNNISNDISTAVVSTQTAAAWTAVPTPTFNPNIPTMVNWLNADLMSTTKSLEWTMDAEYNVTDITFPNIPNSAALIFRVDVSCICKRSADCCIPERTFVVIIESMKKIFTAIMSQVPGEVRQMLVVCSDPKAKSSIGAISASWQDVQAYWQGNLSGYQLGPRVSRTVAP